MVWNPCKWRLLHICTFNFSVINNANMVAVRTSEVGATLNIWHEMLHGNRSTNVQSVFRLLLFTVTANFVRLMVIAIRPTPHMKFCKQICNLYTYKFYADFFFKKVRNYKHGDCVILKCYVWLQLCTRTSGYYAQKSMRSVNLLIYCTVSTFLSILMEIFKGKQTS
jgi:hypothetical protein